MLVSCPEPVFSLQVSQRKLETSRVLTEFQVSDACFWYFSRFEYRDSRLLFLSRNILCRHHVLLLVLFATWSSFRFFSCFGAWHFVMWRLCSGCLFTERSYGFLKKCNISVECAQVTQTTSLCGAEENDWEDLSHVLSFSPDGTSCWEDLWP